MIPLRTKLVIIASRQDYDSPERALTEAAIRLVELDLEAAVDLDAEHALRAIVQRALAVGEAL